MGQTRTQTAAAAGAFDAQAAVERLEQEMAEIRTDITGLKQSTSVIADIQQNMVTVTAMEAMMQKYLAPPASPKGTVQIMHAAGTSAVLNPVSSMHIPAITSAPVAWSSAPHTLGMPLTSVPLCTSGSTTAVMTDSMRCTTTRTMSQGHTQYVLQDNGTHVPVHFQIPPITQPPPQPPEYQTHPPHPDSWKYQKNFSSNYNPVTGQFLPFPPPHQSSQPGSQFRVQQTEYDRNEKVQQIGGVSYYADAVLKGPRLEIPLFAGEDPIGWLQQCEKFFDMSGTPYEQWVNIATGHFYGKANVWLKNICVPWQMVSWQNFCQMIADRFTQANAHEAVEKLKNIQQHGSVQNYIDHFEECVQLVKRDHPYLQELFLMSCFIGGLRPDIKHDVSGQRPTGILQAYWYAKVYENAAAAKKSYYQSIQPRQKGPTNFRFPPKPLQLPGHDKQPPDKPAPQMDRPTRQCWYCKEPWNREHRCRQGRTLHIMQEIEDDPIDTSEPENSPTTEQTYHTAPNTPDHNPAPAELMHLSAHATEGTASIATFSLLVLVGGQHAVALVDSGSSNTFMDYKFALKTNCVLTNMKPRKVSVAGGGHLLSEHSINNVPYSIQGNEFSSTFQVLPLNTYDIILGIDWMYAVSPVTLDLPLRLLTVKNKGRLVQLSDHTVPPEKCMLEPEDMSKLLSKSVLGYIIQIHSLDSDHMTTAEAIPPEIEQILHEFQAVLVEPTGLPPNRDCDHAIPLVDGAQPPNLRPYRVPHMQKDAMEEIILKMLKKAEIRVSLSPYSSPAVMVRKRDGSWRLCVDYRLLNSITIKNKFPMPVIEDLLDELQGATIFSKLDLRSGYHQIRMNTADIPKTAFKTHMGHYEYTVMPFGLTNAPATFQNLMNTIFKPHLRKFILVFFDDILVYSKNMDDHLKHLKIAFAILQEHSLFVKLPKCSFATPQVEYLGHVISAAGVATKPENIEAILNWPIPKTLTKLRGFLGLTGYYRRFVKDYGKICRPLHDLLKKNGFHWTQEHTSAFNQLKQIMTSCPVLALPDFSKAFVLETDACGTGIGAVLMQGGRPLAYLSKSLGPKAAAQSVYEKEALAILEALKKWRHYFLGNSLIIKTDQQSLRYMTTQKLTEGVQHKLLLKLMGFDYTIEYKKGKENIAADSLSRRDAHCHAITVCLPQWMEDVKQSYLQDPDSGKLLRKMARDVSNPSQYTIKDGIIKHGSKIYVGAATNMRLILLETFHSSAIGGHSGAKATYQRIKKVFCWPHLKQMVQKFISECPVCQLVKVPHTAPAGLLQPLPIPGTPWSCLSLDFIEALPKSNGKEVILVVVDRLTKYAHFIAIAHPYTVEKIVEIFMDNIVKLHGFPLEIVSDRDRIFTSTLYQQIFKALRIALKFSTAYHPQTDGQTERVNQCLESYLRSMVFQEPKQWTKWLATAEWWYNTSYHSSLKMTPFEALYHYPPPTVGEFDITKEMCPAAQLTVTEREHMMQQLKNNLLVAQNRMKVYADQHRTDRHYKVGDMVYIRIQPYRQNAFGIRGSLKLRSKYYGPFKILECIGEVAYKLHLPDTAAIHPVFHVSQLKEHVGKHAIPLPHVPLVTEDGKIKTAPFAVLDERTINRQRTPVKQFLIHWESLGPEDATWEDVRFIETHFPDFHP